MKYYALIAFLVFSLSCSGNVIISDVPQTAVQNSTWDNTNANTRALGSEKSFVTTIKFIDYKNADVITEGYVSGKRVSSSQASDNGPVTYEAIEQNKFAISWKEGPISHTVIVSAKNGKMYWDNVELSRK